MKIELLNIEERKVVQTDSGTRLLLANQVIEKFTPLFSEEIDRKRKQLNEHLSDVKMLKKDVSKVKQDLITVNTELKKELIRKEILTEITYLNQHGIIYGQIKQIVKGILSTIDKLTSENLNKNLKILKQIVSSNVNKVIQ